VPLLPYGDNPHLWLTGVICFIDGKTRIYSHGLEAAINGNIDMSSNVPSRSRMQYMYVQCWRGELTFEYRLLVGMIHMYFFYYLILIIRSMIQEWGLWCIYNLNL
jgi:hypothetical protein